MHPNNLADVLFEIQQRQKYNLIDTFYPDEGPFSRDKYPLHTEYLAAGRVYKERACMAGNRVGKTKGLLCYEAAIHAMGDYPHWWKGKVFKTAPLIWLGGDTSTTVRDSIQKFLLGESENGTGLLRRDSIKNTEAKRGTSGAVESIWVYHKGSRLAGSKISCIMLKSYEQDREAWQAVPVEFIGLDECAPQDIRTEALMRTMTTNGIMSETFTPMKGLSDSMQEFMDGAPGKFLQTLSWNDAPHLTEEMKDELRAAIPPNEVDARVFGIPQLGSGKVYQVPISMIQVNPFELPKHWPRAYALDVGYKNTAALWGALDRDSDTIYLYSEYYGKEEALAVNAQAVKSRGDLWGAIDPASKIGSPLDGQKLLDLYRQHGLHLLEADNAVESGIFNVYERMITGRLKVFSTLGAFAKEFGRYHRKEDGKIAKTRDHLMDCMRYLVTTKDKVMRYASGSGGNMIQDRFGNTYISSIPNKKRI